MWIFLRIDVSLFLGKFPIFGRVASSSENPCISSGYKANSHLLPLSPPLREKVENGKKYGVFHKRGYKIALKPYEQCPRMRKSRFPV